MGLVSAQSSYRAGTRGSGPPGPGSAGRTGAGGVGGSLSEAVPGSPGQDYPVYSTVPDTSFLCAGQVDGGYYADPESDCQVKSFSIPAFASVTRFAVYF